MKYILLLIFATLFACSPSSDQIGINSVNDTAFEELKEAEIPVTKSMSETEAFESWAKSTYDNVKSMDIEVANKRRRRRARIEEVKEATPYDPQQLPDWITSKKYVTENIDAIKYEPSLLIGALARIYADTAFEVYPITQNVKKDGDFPELNWIETPTNYYEQTFEQNSRFNTNFLVGKASIGTNKALRVSYKETAYIVLKEFDIAKLENIRSVITANENLNKEDFAIVRGLVIVDCTNSTYSKLEGEVEGSFKFISVGGQLHKEEGVENNFRMISVDLEPLFFDFEP